MHVKLQLRRAREKIGYFRSSYFIYCCWSDSISFSYLQFLFVFCATLYLCGEHVYIPPMKVIAMTRYSVQRRKRQQVSDASENRNQVRSTHQTILSLNLFAHSIHTSTVSKCDRAAIVSLNTQTAQHSLILSEKLLFFIFTCYLNLYAMGKRQRESERAYK